MNKERILILAKLLRMSVEPNRKPKLGFNHGPFRAKTSAELPDQTKHNCGTVACIAGWAVAAFDPEVYKSYIKHGFDLSFGSRAAELLNLNYVQKDQLFAPTSVNGHDRTKTTPIEAAEALEQMARTGKLPASWRRFW